MFCGCTDVNVGLSLNENWIALSGAIASSSIITTISLSDDTEGVLGVMHVKTVAFLGLKEQTKEFNMSEIWWHRYHHVDYIAFTDWSTWNHSIRCPPQCDTISSEITECDS